MQPLELCLLAIGLAMDACAVSLCKGLSFRPYRASYACVTGAYFGLFQAFMPFVGYLLCWHFQDMIHRVDHWIAFLLLIAIGGHMIVEAKAKKEDSPGTVLDRSLHPASMIPSAIATSIDALAVGITFASLKINIWWACTVIGLITFTLSALGCWIGHAFGARCRTHAEGFGGILLILLGCKILLSHLR